MAFFRSVNFGDVLPAVTGNGLESTAAIAESLVRRAA